MNAQVFSYGVVISFHEAPNEVTLARLRHWGFKWQGKAGYWFRPRKDGAQDAIDEIRRCYAATLQNA